MIKREKITKIIVIPKYFCDVCGNETSTVHVCEKCRRHLCSTCVEHQEFHDDYIEYYCHNCWELGKVHLERIRQLEDEINHEYGKWEEECKNN